MEYVHKVVKVVPKEDYTVDVTFEDGRKVNYDARKLIDKPAFSSLKDKLVFVNSCLVLNDTLAWDIVGDRSLDNCLDIDPETLYSLPNVSDE